MATKDAIKAALDQFENQMHKPDFKLSLAEYLKLLQIEEELDQESPKEIKVTWVEPETKSDGEK